MLSRSLKQLANNRLMLRVIIDLQEMDKSSTVLENKGQLLQLLNEEQLKRNLARQKNQLLELEVVETLLEHIAYSMYRARSFSYHERTLMDTINTYLEEWHEPHHWRQVVNFLRESKMLVRDGRRYWQFSDRTTAAYFAAAAMAHSSSRFEDMLGEISELWWREVLEIMVGLSRQSNKLFFQLMDQDALVAAHCAQYCVLSDRVTNALIDTLIERMADENVDTRVRISLRLGHSGHVRAPEALIRALHREKSSRVVVAIARALWFWARPQKKKFDALKRAESTLLRISTMQLEPFSHLMDTFEEIANSDEDGQRTKVTLLEDLMHDSTKSRLCRGLCAVGLGLSPVPEAVEALLDSLVNDELDEFVAWCAVDALAKSGDPSIEQRAIEIFQDDQFRSDQWRRLRARVVYLMGWVCSGDETRQLLGDKALLDEDFLTRRYAVDSLVRLDLPDTRERVEKLLEREENPAVIRKCAQALSQIGTLASLPSLEKHLTCERARTRWKVRSAIADIQQRYAPN